METFGLAKKTLIILTADHGEALGEHNLYFTHGEFLYDELLKVPLIIKLEKLLPENKIINHQVRLIDILPTILHILHIRWNKNKQIEGVSFLPLVLRNYKFPELYAFSVFGNQKSIRTCEWKLISSDKGYELYNLRKDPKELTNLVNTEKEQFEFLKAKLEEWMNRPKPEIKPLKKPLDEETKEKLKSLGYLQ